MIKKAFVVLITFGLVFTACSRKDKNKESNAPLSTEENSSESLELIDNLDFYVPALDDGEWVDYVLSSMEEERIADELESMSELESVLRGGHTYENESDKPVEVRLLDSLNELKIMEYGNEIFIPDFSGGKLVFINKCKEKVTRFFYDERYRLVKKEHWNIPDEKTASISLEEELTYAYDNVIPYSKTVTSGDSRSRTVYNDKGLPHVLEIYKYSDKTKRWNILNSSSWEYDEEKRITKEEVTDYTGAKTSVKTELYYYKTEDMSDYEYYEDGNLKISIVYSSKTAYTKQIFFDEDFSVKTYYDEDKKIRDEYYNGDTFVREKIYE